MPQFKCTQYLLDHLLRGTASDYVKIYPDGSAHLTGKLGIRIRPRLKRRGLLSKLFYFSEGGVMEIAIMSPDGKELATIETPFNFTDTVQISDGLNVSIQLHLT
jgi:hypothetical protein